MAELISCSNCGREVDAAWPFCPKCASEIVCPPRSSLTIPFIPDDREAAVTVNGQKMGQGRSPINVDNPAKAGEDMKIVISMPGYKDFVMNAKSTGGGMGYRNPVVLEPDDALEAGVLTISTAEELAAFAKLVNGGEEDFEGKTVRLAGDIDLAGYDNWDPIGGSFSGFSGTFDGSGHVICNLTINRPDGEYQGLFGEIYHGTIKNLVLKNVNISGKEKVGGVVGMVAESTVTDCQVEGTISGKENVGGVVGCVYESTVTNCQVGGTISGGKHVGGVVEFALKSTVTNCQVEGAISGEDKVGGVVGKAAESIVTACRFEGTISGGTAVGGVVGEADDRCTVTDCQFEVTINGEKSGGNIVGYQITKLEREKHEQMAQSVEREVREEWEEQQRKQEEQEQRERELRELREREQQKLQELREQREREQQKLQELREQQEREQQKLQELREQREQEREKERRKQKEQEAPKKRYSESEILMRTMLMRDEQDRKERREREEQRDREQQRQLARKNDPFSPCQDCYKYIYDEPRSCDTVKCFRCGDWMCGSGNREVGGFYYCSACASGIAY